MELKILIFLSSSIILSSMGIAETMHSDRPSCVLFKWNMMASEPIKNTTEVPVADELLTVKKMYPSLRNYKRRTSSLEKRISKETSVEKVQEDMNKFNDVLTEKNDVVSYNFDKDTSTLLQNISITEAKDVILNQVELMLRESNSVQNNTTNIKAFNQRKTITAQQHAEENNTANKEQVSYTSNKTSDNGNDNNTSAKLRFHQPVNITSGNKKLVVLPFLLVLPENTSNRKSNQSGSAAERIFSNKNTHQHSNESRINGAECCEGKTSQIIYNVDKDYPKRFYKAIEEEEKLNDKYIEYLGDKTPQLNMNYGNLIETNKQENTFREIKLLMSRHFQSLNIKQVGVAKNGNISITETIARSQNIFQLIEKLNKILKILLETKEANEEEPYSLIKTIVEKQIEKCNERYNESKIEMNDIDTTLAKVENNESIMSFIKCVNINFKKCIRNFGLWLKTRKFYLRPRFKLSKAYKMYERIYVLDCR